MSAYLQSNAQLIASGGLTLTAADSGKIIMVVQTGGQSIVLPPVATSSGVTYKFIVKTAAAAVTRILSGVGGGVNIIIVGHALNGPIAANHPSIVVGAGTNGVSFSSTCIVGDTIELYCNGINWFAEGFTGSNVLLTGITFTTV